MRSYRIRCFKNDIFTYGTSKFVKTLNSSNRAFYIEIRISTNRNYPFDFLLPAYSLIIEVDGEQHFTQVQNWTAPEINRERDIYKMKMAIENGYSVIRVLQEDIIEDKNNWKETLKNLIKKYNTLHIHKP